MNASGACQFFSPPPRYGSELCLPAPITVSMQSNTHIPTEQRSLGETDDAAFPVQQYLRGTDQGRIRVLHVDDEPDFADMTATFLERIRENVTVDTETTASDGLDRLPKEDYECVVSDYQMPGMDGLEFLDAVRHDHPELPFILFTGQGSEEIAEDAITAGVTDYLQKGSGSDRFEMLANRIRNAVDRYRAEQELWTTLTWYRRLVEQKLAGIYLIQDETYQYVNARFADIFGYDQAELIGESVYTIVADEDRSRVAANLRKREQGDADAIEYTLTGEHRDGHRIELAVHGGTIQFNEEPAVLGTLLDTTDRD